MTSIKNTHHLQDTKKMDFFKKGYKDFFNFFSGASAYVWSSLISKKSLSFPKNMHKSPKPKCGYVAAGYDDASLSGNHGSGAVNVTNVRL